MVVAESIASLRGHEEQEPSQSAAEGAPASTMRRTASGSLATLATEIMRSSSFHDLSMWSESEAAASSNAEGMSQVLAEAPSSRQPRFSRKASLEALRTIAPQLSNKDGTALSPTGVAAFSAAGAVCCHAIRLMLRELLEALVVPSRSRSRASWRTFELYMLSLLHSSAWVALGLRRWKQRASWDEAGEGATRLLCMSSGYHVYVLLSLKSVWAHPIATVQQLAELVNISSQLRSQSVGALATQLGALRALPTCFLAALSTLEHLGEPSTSRPFRALSAAAALSLVGCKAVATPYLLFHHLRRRAELHQPALLPSKLVVVGDAAASVAWLSSHLAARWATPAAAAAAAAAAAPSAVAPQLLGGARRLLHHLRMHGAMLFVTAGFQAAYLTTPTLALAAAAARRRPRLRAALLGCLGVLVASLKLPLPRRPPLRLLQTLFIDSGLVKLMKDYHDFQLIEEVAPSELPQDRGLLYACFPHGVFPFGVVLMWCEMLRQGRLLGGLGASVLFRIPLLRHGLAAIDISPATNRNLARRLQTAGSRTFLVPGGIAEMFLNDPDREVVNLAERKGFCKHALASGAPLLPVYIFGQTQLFYTLTGRVQELLRRLSRRLRVSLIPFVGRSWLSPFVPLQEPLTCVVGRPINLGAAPIDAPTAAQVDALHAQFCAELRRLFEAHKHRHPGYAEKRLYFDGEEGDVASRGEAEELRERRRLEEFHVFPAKM